MPALLKTRIERLERTKEAPVRIFGVSPWTPVEEVEAAIKRGDALIWRVIRHMEGSHDVHPLCDEES